MSSLKKRWDELLRQSVAIAAVLAIVSASLILLLVVGIAVVISKILLIIR